MVLESEGSEAAYILNELNSRIRILEGKYNLYGERLLVVNKNMIEEYKKLLRQMKVIGEELVSLKTDMDVIKENLKEINREMQFFAKKENVKLLEKYINMWNPLNFVTEKELNKTVEEAIERMRKKSPDSI